MGSSVSAMIINKDIKKKFELKDNTSKLKVNRIRRNAVPNLNSDYGILISSISKNIKESK